jgi:hypothetical protein
MRHEIDPGRNVVDIHEELIAAEGLCEPVIQPTSHADRIISAVIDENLTSHIRSPRKTTNHTAGSVNAL